MSAIEAIKNGDAEVVTMTRAQAYGFVNNFGHDNEDDEGDIMDELNNAFEEAQGKANAAGVKSYILIEIEGGPTP